MAKSTTQQLLQELVRIADSLINGMTPQDKIDWINSLDDQTRHNFFTDKPKCVLPIRYMDSETLQPYFVICNKQGMVDPDLIKIAIDKCREEIGSSRVDQEHLLATLKRLMRLYKMYSNGPATCPRMAYLKGRATQRLNSIGMALQRIV